MTRARIEALAAELNAAIADIERPGILRASVITSWDSKGGPQSVSVEIRERSPLEMELRKL
jgi:hypothetical protein